MVKKGLLGFVSLLMILVILPMPTTAQDAAYVYYYPPYPQDVIGITQPEIGWKVHLMSNEIEYAQFWLNDEPIDVQYDQQRETFFYRPEASLQGENKVTAKIKLKHWSNLLEDAWLFKVADDAINGLPLPNEQQLKALNFANDYRYTLGIPLYRYHSSLNMAAQKHAAYQEVLQAFGHQQKRGTPGFFGVTVGDRAAYYGFYGSVFEDISYQSHPSVQEAVDRLFDAPYHRIPFLIPSYQYFGYGKKGYYHVLNFGSQQQSDLTWVAYPGANEEQVPIAWENFETPDPLRFYKNTPQRVGYPIVAGVFGKEVEQVTLKSATLWDRNGHEIPLYMNSPSVSGGNDENLKQEVLLIPKSPLSLSTTYKVQVILDVIVNGSVKTIEKTWVFSTEEKEGTGKKKLHQQVDYPAVSGEKIQFRIGQSYLWLDDVAYPLDVSPFIIHGRSMIPVRVLANSLGAEVRWEANTRTVIYQTDTKTIELPIGKSYAIVNGKTVPLDQGAMIKHDRSFVPIRFISEQLGADVRWLSDAMEVLIKTH